jgi:hypothetical protein
MAQAAKKPLPNQIWKLREGAAEIGRTERQFRYLIETGGVGDAVVKLPGGRFVVFRDKLRARFGRLRSDPDPILEPPRGPGRSAERVVQLVPATDPVDAA